MTPGTPIPDHLRQPEFIEPPARDEEDEDA